jgi:hypothetical protein
MRRLLVGYSDHDSFPGAKCRAASGEEPRASMTPAMDKELPKACVLDMF